MNETAPNAIDWHVGNRIAIRRIAIRMSQERLAERLGLSLQQVQDCEQGKNRVGVRTILEAADILDVDVPYFYDGLSDHSKAYSPMADLLDLLK